MFLLPAPSVLDIPVRGAVKALSLSMDSRILAIAGNCFNVVAQVSNSLTLDRASSGIQLYDIVANQEIKTPALLEHQTRTPATAVAWITKEACYVLAYGTSTADVVNSRRYLRTVFYYNFCNTAV